MFSPGNFLAKAVFCAKVKVQSWFDMISRQIGSSIFREDSNDASSARLFCLLNLMFLASLILLSPDKVTEALPSARPSWLTSDWIQDVVETLGKLVPF